MNIFKYTLLVLSLSIGFGTYAQQKRVGEDYGRALNIGLGLGYYGYIGYSLPVLHADYEIDVAKSFTLAPFINILSYQNNYYYGNRNYYHRETVIPIGLKGSYYFDDLLNANSHWDFYGAGSIGFVYRRTVWENGYNGRTDVGGGPGSLFLDLHIGTEYHISSKVGLFLDLSTGVSTVGLAFHL